MWNRGIPDDRDLLLFVNSSNGGYHHWLHKYDWQWWLEQENRQRHAIAAAATESVSQPTATLDGAPDVNHDYKNGVRLGEASHPGPHSTPHSPNARLAGMHGAQRVIRSPARQRQPRSPARAARPAASMRSSIHRAIRVIPRRNQAWVLDPNPDRSWLQRGATLTRSQLIAASQAARSLAREPSTRRKYLRWWQRFTIFCTSRRIRFARSRARIPLPITPLLLQMWVTALAQQYAASSIEAAIAAIQAVCSSNGHAFPTSWTAAHIEAIARHGIRTVRPTFVVRPTHVMLMMSLQQVTVGPRPWTVPRLHRGQAIVAAGFGAWLRPGELRNLDRCDWIPHASTSTAQHRIAEIRIVRAKNDTRARGRSAWLGTESQRATHLVTAIDRWVHTAQLQIHRACTKTAQPRERCAACGPLFRSLSVNGTINDREIGSSVVTRDLRLMYAQLQQSGDIAATDPTHCATAQDLRRGGHTAAAAQGVPSVTCAAHGRWANIVTPARSYTFIQQNRLAQVTATMLQ